MAKDDPRKSIQAALQACARGRLAAGAAVLFNALGYGCAEAPPQPPGTPEQFLAMFDPAGQLDRKTARLDQWKTAEVLFQWTDGEIHAAYPARSAYPPSPPIDPHDAQSFLFVVIDMAGEHYPRSVLANITRAVHALFPMPVLVVLRHGERLTFAIIFRRAKAGSSALEKVTLIRAVEVLNPHPAHLEILRSLSIRELLKRQQLARFSDLLSAWESALDTAERGKKFYRQVAKWYFQALRADRTLPGSGLDAEKQVAAEWVRLIIREVFRCFLKEQALPELLTRSEPGPSGIDPEKTRGLLPILERDLFTLEENTPLEEEVALDPEVLGRVFENLLAASGQNTRATARRQTGSFYTPREIADAMVDEALAAYLETALEGAPDARQRLHRLLEYSCAPHPFNAAETLRLVAAIDAAKILDPACGSGAFAMGVLHKLVFILARLDPDNRLWKQRQLDKTAQIFDPAARARAVEAIAKLFDEQEPDYSRKWYLIHNNIYGVDIQPIALEITRLRFMLSLAVHTCAAQHEGSSCALANLKPNLAAANFLTSADGPQASAGQQSTACFDPEKRFGLKAGFDVVIGNPPYVKEYTHREAFDGLRGSPYYQGKMDLWYIFACRALDVLKAKTGLLVFIATNNWVSNAGASRFREKVITEARIEKLIDFGQYRVFESAGIQTMILVIRRDDSPPEYTLDIRKIISPGAVGRSVLDIFNGEPQAGFRYLRPRLARSAFRHKLLLFTEDAQEALLQKIHARANFFLDGKTEVAQGIVCPQDFVNRASKAVLGDRVEVGDGIFVLHASEKASLALAEAELSLLKPYYTTGSLGRYYGSPENAYWIIYTGSTFKNPAAMRDFPHLQTHLDRFAPVITSVNCPYGLHRSRDPYFFTDSKIIALRKCAAPTFTYTDFDCYVSQTFNVIKSSRIDLKYLVAVLNSRLVAFWLKYKGKMQGHLYQVDKEPLVNIPIVAAGGESQKAIIREVDRILAIKGDDRTIHTLEHEAALDRRIYDLYGLSKEEIALIEEG